LVSSSHKAALVRKTF